MSLVQPPNHREVEELLEKTIAKTDRFERIVSNWFVKRMEETDEFLRDCDKKVFWKAVLAAVVLNLISTGIILLLQGI